MSERQGERIGEGTKNDPQKEKKGTQIMKKKPIERNMKEIRNEGKYGGNGENKRKK